MDFLAEKTDEFDEEFYQNNIGVIKSQQFLRQNISQFIALNDSIERDYSYKVNMSNIKDFRIWKQGLNPEKRGCLNKSIPFIDKKVEIFKHKDQGLWNARQETLSNLLNSIEKQEKVIKKTIQTIGNENIESKKTLLYRQYEMASQQIQEKYVEEILNIEQEVDEGGVSIELQLEEVRQPPLISEQQIPVINLQSRSLQCEESENPVGRQILIPRRSSSQKNFDELENLSPQNIFDVPDKPANNTYLNEIQQIMIGAQIKQNLFNENIWYELDKLGVECDPEHIKNLSLEDQKRLEEFIICYHQEHSNSKEEQKVADIYSDGDLSNFSSFRVKISNEGSMKNSKNSFISVNDLQVESSKVESAKHCAGNKIRRKNPLNNLKFDSPFQSDWMHKSSDSGQSQIRKDRLQSLQEEYSHYLQNQHGFFIVRFEMMRDYFIQLTQNTDIKSIMTDLKNFKAYQENTKMNNKEGRRKTIVIDIENTLISKVDIKTLDELNQLRLQTNFDTNYLVVEKEDQMCCPSYQTPKCNCFKHQVYLIRPYTLVFLRALRPFFEIIAFSRIPRVTLENIIYQIEEAISAPSKANLSSEEQKSDPIISKRAAHKKKIYFNFIIFDKFFIPLKDEKCYIENLMILTGNRKIDDILLLSSDPLRLVAARSLGFLAIPILPYETFYTNDFQLCLVENYILKHRHCHDLSVRCKIDFQFITQKIKNPLNPLSQQSSSMKSLFEQSSFGGGGSNSSSGPKGTITSKNKSSKQSSKHQSSNKEEEKQECPLPGRVQYDAQLIILEENSESIVSNHLQLSRKSSPTTPKKIYQQAVKSDPLTLSEEFSNLNQLS